MSKLSKWLAKQPRGTRAFLDREVSESAVARAFRGEPIGYHLARDLSVCTGGAVTVADLCTRPSKKRGSK